MPLAQRLWIVLLLLLRVAEDVAGLPLRIRLKYQGAAVGQALFTQFNGRNNGDFSATWSRM